MQWGLEVIRGNAAPRIMELFDTIVLGREPGVEMRVIDPSASRRHASISRTKDQTGWILIDLNSSNGTFLNGEKVQQQRIRPGDIIQIGDTHLRLFDVREGQRQTVILGGAPSESAAAAQHSRPSPANALIGSGPTLQRLRQQIETIAKTEATVLICGPTGSGKELAARMLHDFSPRKKGPFQAINCAAIPPNFVESELFGYEKGAFTGADRLKPGKFELAAAGTLFLDEIGEMPMEAQAKLLRALETKSVERIGGTRTVPVDVRFITATNRDLMAEMQRGNFREDLYYRLCVATIHMPALAEHIEDLEELVAHFLGPQTNRHVTPAAMDLLRAYPWPGSVRELKNTLEAASLHATEGSIEPSHVQAVLALRTPQPAPEPGTPNQAPPTADATSLRESERRSILAALQATAWNKSAAARRLGISRPTLHKKIKEYELKP